MDIPKISVVWNWGNQNNITDVYSIHLCISINRISKYYKIQIPKKVSREEWSGKDEMGKGFSFVVQQKRILAEDEHFYVDLVFHNYILKCFVLT